MKIHFKVHVNKHTVDEKIIDTQKIQNNFWAVQYWMFSIAPHFVITLPTLQ